MDRKLDKEDRAAIAKAQTEGGQAKGKRLEETMTKAVKAGQADARKRQDDHPDEV